MTTAHEFLATKNLVLLDFDGPVTRLLPPPANADLTDTVRDLAIHLGARLAPEEMSTTDHLTIIRAAHRSGMAVLVPVEGEATRLEVDAAQTSPITPGVSELLQQLAARHAPVSIVTNNSPDCVRTFLRRNDLDHLVHSVFGRDPAHIDRMKPSPWMLNAALAGHPHMHAIMIGDSVSDAIAATAAGIESVGLAKSETRAQELHAAGARVQIHSLASLLTTSPRSTSVGDEGQTGTRDSGSSQMRV